MSRIFIALTPQSDFNLLISELKKDQKKYLYKDNKISWSKNDQHHITVNFIGSMEPEQQEEMFDALNHQSSFNSLPIEISHLSYFPNENGQVLVANVSLSSRLEKLHKEVEAIVARIGFGMSLKSFRPHISLARFKEKNRPFSQLIALEEPIGSSINSLDVYESVFESGQTLHSLIKSYPFEQKNTT